jgi:hypothetical protein
MTKETDDAGPLRQPTPSELVSHRQWRPLRRAGTGDLMVVDSKRKLVLDYLVHNCYTRTATAFMGTQLFGEREDDEENGYDEERIEIAEHRQGRKLPISNPINLSLTSLSYHRDKGSDISREDRSSDSQGG